MQSRYTLETYGDKKQISRFNEEGNRIVVIKVESFVEDVEIQFILRSLNACIDYADLNGIESYQSPDNKEGLIYFK
jgi:hypothetical protein